MEDDLSMCSNKVIKLGCTYHQDIYVWVIELELFGYIHLGQC